MGYDITVSGAEGRGGALNWSRNPFGLCNFAESNVGEKDGALWHVCNDHAYDDVGRLDRAQFLKVVSFYWDRLRGLQDARFYFTFHGYVHFAPQHPDAMLLHGRGHGDCWSSGNDLLAIPVERFKGEQNFAWSDHGLGPSPGTVLDHYKEWFRSLLELAKAMQDPASVVCITN